MNFISIEDRKYHNSEIFVTTDWLEKNRLIEDIIVLDLDAKDQYEKSHIPGALNVSDNYYKTSMEDRIHVQGRSQIEDTFSKLGINNNTTVVGYDRSSSLYSFRLAWVMMFYGHKNIKVLDGGFPKWIYEKRQIEKGSLHSKITGNFKARDPNEEIFADKSLLLEILNNKDQNSYQILDVRSEDERNGINKRGGPRGGYIPKSIHKEWVNFNTDSEVPMLKSSDEILDITKDLGLNANLPTITYCQGGIRAAHVFWALKLSGFKEIKNYDASWREWGNDYDCPIVDLG